MSPEVDDDWDHLRRQVKTEELVPDGHELPPLVACVGVVAAGSREFVEVGSPSLVHRLFVFKCSFASSHRSR